MKRLETIMAIITAVAFIMKLAMIAGAGMLLIFSVMLLAGIYYPFGFAFFNGIDLLELTKKEVYKNISVKRIIGAVGVGIGLSAVCMGILFKIQHFPGATIMLSSGLVVVAIALLVSLLFFFRNKDAYYSNIVKRIAIIGVLGLTMLFLPPLTIEKIRFHNHPAYIKALEAYTNNPQNDTLKQKMLDEYRKAITPNSDIIENTRGMSKEPN